MFVDDEKEKFNSYPWLILYADSLLADTNTRDFFFFFFVLLLQVQV